MWSRWLTLREWVFEVNEWDFGYITHTPKASLSFCGLLPVEKYANVNVYDHSKRSERHESHTTKRSPRSARANFLLITSSVLWISVFMKLWMISRNRWNQMNVGLECCFNLRIVKLPTPACEHASTLQIIPLLWFILEANIRFGILGNEISVSTWFAAISIKSYVWMFNATLSYVCICLWDGQRKRKGSFKYLLIRLDKDGVRGVKRAGWDVNIQIEMRVTSVENNISRN